VDNVWPLLVVNKFEQDCLKLIIKLFVLLNESRRIAEAIELKMKPSEQCIAAQVNKTVGVSSQLL
jgi:hypothetical protein